VVAACDVLDAYLDAIAEESSPSIRSPYSALHVSLVYLTALREARALLATVYQPSTRLQAIEGGADLADTEALG
jgi:hypothetical protein